MNWRAQIGTLKNPYALDRYVKYFGYATNMREL